MTEIRKFIVYNYCKVGAKKNKVPNISTLLLVTQKVKINHKCTSKTL